MPPAMALSSRAFSSLPRRAPAAPRLSFPAKSGTRRFAAPRAAYEAGVGILANKAGMTSVFSEDGELVPVTVIALGEGNVVTQVKTEETDGYNAVQVGYACTQERRISMPELGHLKKLGCPPMKHLQEFRLDTIPENFGEDAPCEPGAKLPVGEMFKEGDLVDVQGTSVGKGFQSAIKRYGYHRGLMTHGSKSHRELGSTGCGTTPGRTYPGKGMPGQMGGKTVKVQKLKVVKVDAENNYMLVKGSVPGKPGNLLRITPAKIVGKNIPKN